MSTYTILYAFISGFIANSAIRLVAPDRFGRVLAAIGSACILGMAVALEVVA